MQMAKVVAQAKPMVLGPGLVELLVQAVLVLVLLVVQGRAQGQAQGLEPPLQMLVQMLGQLDYRHELPQPVLSDQANLVQHHRGCC